jgi:rhodanese-related sulfurtransferase
VITEITRDALARALADDPALVVLEALPERYYREAHLPRAHRVDVAAVRDQIQPLAPDLATPIVVYCASETCQNSHQAAEALVAAGYTRVRVYREGKQGWRAAGLPVER